MDSAPEVVTVGHAIVDVLAPSEDSLVASFGLEKGTMTLVDDSEAEKIYAALGPATEASGGSAANTAACLASLGASVEFVGKVADDDLGRVFVHDIRAAGVRFEVPPARGGPGTGRCLVMVSPDAEKTMCTNLGVGALLGPDDVGGEAIGAATVVYIEGYLCGKPETDPAVERAVSAAKAGGTLVAFSGSDPSWVDLKRLALDALLDRVDVLFANEAEACGLAGVDTVEAALSTLSRRCPAVAITLGARGSIVATGSQVVSVPAAPVSRVVDTTGAGDSFAAGFLYGVVRDLGPEASARLGALAAGEIVSHLGARPLARLADLMAGEHPAGS
jgi:sugar/nucleoside kinase (ribokinase family)